MKKERQGPSLCQKGKNAAGLSQRQARENGEGGARILVRGILVRGILSGGGQGSFPQDGQGKHLEQTEKQIWAEGGRVVKVLSVKVLSVKVRGRLLQDGEESG